ncbi:hypothetical protein CLAVI_000304 [Candidatus Clavichlamydia salmonicola]|uniref:hypothetical protein n=1 Tax=Candidatus Clavichlamydia salmonicola TaxID=469812 RepID=UPI001890F44F|nr:hypothetical protein [Candidatus Clavichlamydia salmonicola]MBF5050689.1 hypothetical protein [Candidatus Clavichlamydia salmonicola]
MSLNAISGASAPSFMSDGNSGDALLTSASTIMKFWSRLGVKAIQQYQTEEVIEEELGTGYSFPWIDLRVFNAKNGTLQSVLINEKQYSGRCDPEIDGGEGILGMWRVLKIVKDIANWASLGHQIDFICPGFLDGGGQLSAGHTVQLLSSLINLGRGLVRSSALGSSGCVPGDEIMCQMTKSLALLDVTAKAQRIIIGAGVMGDHGLGSTVPLSALIPYKIAVKSVLKFSRGGSLIRENDLKELFNTHPGLLEEFLWQFDIDIDLLDDGVFFDLKIGSAREAGGAPQLNLLPLYSFVPGWKSMVQGIAVKEILHIQEIVKSYV